MILRPIKPIETEGLTQHSPIVWTSTDAAPEFVFETNPKSSTFFCFFLACDGKVVGPKVVLDHGAGFDEMTTMAFRPFPFGFYHMPPSTIDHAERVLFRPCDGRTTFRLISFETDHSVLVAILHFLFNLRYQKIGLVAPAPRGIGGVWTTIISNVSRIRKFFGDVSAGSGIRVQQAEDDVLAQLRLSQTHHVGPVMIAMRERLASSGQAPLLSFVSPVFDTDPEILRELLKSFVAEDAPYSELILVDDCSTKNATKEVLTYAETLPRVRVFRKKTNGGIAVSTNAGIEVSRGTWVSFIDHDDAFVRGATAMIAQAILANTHAEFFYTDEIIADMTMKPIGTFLKPTYDSVLLSGLNYINHFSIFRRDKLVALGGLRLDREGSQDYDLLLRYLRDAEVGSIVHIPFLAYAWRRGEGTYSTIFQDRSVDNARAALAAAYVVNGQATRIDAASESNLHRVRFLSAPAPLVSIVIPNRDSLSLIKRIVADIHDRTSYPSIEIIIADNGSADAAVLAFYEAQKGDDFRVDVVPEPFNFSRMCNRGARHARGDAILFLNNDIEVTEPAWLAEMVECLSFRDTAIVGAKLLYPNGTIQHAGVIVGLGGAAGHWHIECDGDHPGPMGRLRVRQTLTAVTGACMLVTRSCFEALEGFDETAFGVAYNDIDFCIRARQKGYRTVWTPFATLTHHESASRGSDETGENAIRFRAEMRQLKDRHATETMIDEAYSPFYDRRYSKPHLIVPEDLQAPRRNSLA